MPVNDLVISAQYLNISFHFHNIVLYVCLFLLLEDDFTYFTYKYLDSTIYS